MMGETAEENPPLHYAGALGAHRRRRSTRFALAAPSGCSRSHWSWLASTSWCVAQGQARLSYGVGQRWQGGGPASRSLGPGISAACPHGPPALLKPFRSGLQLPHLVDGPPLWMSSSSLHLLVRFFPTNRAGASNPGDDSISYGTGKPGTARYTAAVRRGSSVKTQSPAASHRPRHRDPLLAGQPASLLLA